MATVMEKVRLDDVGQLAEGIKITPVAMEILRMEKAIQARFDSLGDLKGSLWLAG